MYIQDSILKVYQMAPKLDDKFNELFTFYRGTFLGEVAVLHLMKMETKRTIKELELIKERNNLPIVRDRIKFYELFLNYINIYERKNSN